MPTFTLNWDNTAVLASANVTAQRVSYRRKDVGGSWITAGFTPINDLPKTAFTVLSPDLLFNVLYEFRVQAICVTGGPTINSNGIQEALAFLCLEADISATDTASTISIDTTGTNITKVRFTLKKTSDNSIVAAPLDVVVTGDTAQRTATGLTASTEYYWEWALIAVVNGVEIVSSDLFTPCSEEFETAVPAACIAPGELFVSQPEI